MGRLSFDNTLLDNEYFPYDENELYEFKLTMSPKLTSTIEETICAFLNRNGGFILLGVNNNRCIEGIERESFDSFKTTVIDGIFHAKKIIKHEDRIVLDYSLLDVYLYTNCFDKTICVIIVNTDLEEIKESTRNVYYLKKGESFFRMSASNRKVSGDQKLYTREEANSLFKSLLLEMAHDYSKQLESINEKYKKSYRREQDLEMELFVEKEKNSKLAELEKENKLLKKELNMLLNNLTKFD